MVWKKAGWTDLEKRLTGFASRFDWLGKHV